MQIDDPAVRSVRVAVALSDRFAEFLKGPSKVTARKQHGALIGVSGNEGELSLRIGEAQQLYPKSGATSTKRGRRTSQPAASTRSATTSCAPTRATGSGQPSQRGRKPMAPASTRSPRTRRTRTSIRPASRVRGSRARR